MKQYILKYIGRNDQGNINGEFLASDVYYMRTKSNTTSHRGNSKVFSEHHFYHREYGPGKSNNWEVVPFYQLDETSKTPYYDLYESMRSN